MEELSGWLELLGGLSVFMIIFFIVAGAILLFFLPFYVAGIYNRVKKCQKELEKLNQTLRSLKISSKL